MKAAVTIGTIVLAYILLTGCGGGDTSPINSNQFSGTTMKCQDGSFSNTGCTAPGTGDTTAVSIITDANYKFLASRISMQIDYLIRPHSGNPPALARLALQLLQEMQHPASINLCTPDPASPPPLTLNANSVLFDDCLTSSDFLINGSINISNINYSGDTSNTIAEWDAQADFNIGSLTLAFPGRDKSIDINGIFNLNTSNNLNSSTTTLTLTNLGINENNTDPDTGQTISGNPDTYTNTVLVGTTDPNDQTSVEISGSVNNNSMTQDTLSLLSSPLPSPLTWTAGVANPSMGWLKITDSGQSSSLTLTADSPASMIIDLNGAAADSLSWGSSFIP